ncbi:MAG TPA: hypothetical protein GXZ78_01755 [Eubacteriaceae bacterium]|jgi:hypothetical protein|nr:hypothetical protein [Eubacteriaceae bacterium]
MKVDNFVEFFGSIKCSIKTIFTRVISKQDMVISIVKPIPVCIGFTMLGGVGNIYLATNILDNN